MKKIFDNLDQVGGNFKTIIISSKHSGNDLMRIRIKIDPKLSREEKEALIDLKIMDAIEWREE